MLPLVLFVISGLFALILGVKRKLSLKVCVLCASVAITWISLLFLYRTQHFHDVALLSLLMGQSVTGLFYFVRKMVAPQLKIFTLPFFLTLTVIFYFVITLSRNVLPALWLLLGLWIAAYIIFMWRNDPGKKPLGDMLMHCCEDK